MITLAIILSFSPQKESFVLPGVTVFLILQICVIGAQANENPQAVFYKPSCVVALLDAISKFLFVTLGVFKLISIFGNHYFWISPVAVGVLFLYIAFRKLFIIKNYSYEI